MNPAVAKTLGKILHSVANLRCQRDTPKQVAEAYPLLKSLANASGYEIHSVVVLTGRSVMRAIKIAMTKHPEATRKGNPGVFNGVLGFKL